MKPYHPHALFGILAWGYLHGVRSARKLARYARRKAIVEPVFGQLKDARGFTTLSLRGLARAAGEYLLACLAHNLGKLLRVCPLPGARPTVMAA